MKTNFGLRLVLVVPLALAVVLMPRNLRAQSSGSQTLQIDVVKVPNGQQVQWQRGEDGELHPVMKSYAPGIAQTQAELDRLDGQIALDITDGSVALPKILSDLAGYLPGPPGGDAFKQLVALDQHADIAKAISSGDYHMALAKALEELVNFFVNPEAAPAVAGGETLLNGVANIDLITDVGQAWLTLRDQEQALATRDQIFQQLLRLQGSDPAALDYWNKLYTQVHGDPAAEHRAFLDWLSKNNVSEQSFIQGAMRNAAAAGPAAVASTARGLTIVDPGVNLSDIANIPGINPDFLAALRRCELADAQYAATPSYANYLNQLTCDKNPDGSYVSAFGAQPNSQVGTSSSQRGSFWNNLGNALQILNDLNSTRQPSSGAKPSQPANTAWDAYTCQALAQHIAYCNSCPPPDKTGPSLCELTCRDGRAKDAADWAAHCASGNRK